MHREAPILVFARLGDTPSTNCTSGRECKKASIDIHSLQLHPDQVQIFALESDNAVFQVRDSASITQSLIRQDQLPKIRQMTKNINDPLQPAFVLADIGGTNARFALYSPQQGGEIQLYEQQQYRCAQFSDFSKALSTYLDQTGHVVEGACVSIAGPAEPETIHITNLGWTFSISEVKETFGFQHMWVINDATAAALSTTRDAQLELIKSGHAETAAIRINVIPGTGFGVGCIMPLADGWLPIQGECGHATLAPVTDEEFAVLQHITRENGRAVNDIVLSGPGMLNIYQALAAVRGEQALHVDARQMTRHALDCHDETSVDALDMYCTLLGRLSGDLALTMNAHGGVYLSGDLLQKLGATRISDSFITGFNDKGKMADKVGRIPVYLLHSEFPCLKGAAVWLASQSAKISATS